MKDQLTLINILIVVSGVVAAVSAWAFVSLHNLDKKIDKEIMEHRHDYKGRFKHVYQRILRLELWASRPQAQRKSLDINSDLPDIGGDERKHKN